MRDFKMIALWITTCLWLMLAWVMLWGGFSSPGTWVAGLGIGLVVMVFFPLPRRKVIGEFHLFHALRLAGYVAIRVMQSSIEVAYISLNPRRRPKPALLMVPMRLESDFVLSLAVNTLNIIPGGIVCRIDERNRQVILHVLNTGTAREVEKFYHDTAKIEAMYVRAFEPQENVDKLAEAMRSSPIAPAVRDEWLVDGAAKNRRKEDR
ncbi:Na+/H+ antiporter subunit E [Dietzia sp.]|uniref:Na+/H+ antiporter subunit E n=1 Tax=Dietzia sp. TaxID=1871616 RepID=UPI002FDB19AC